ncbi:MAG: hypothetical protein HZA95_04015 [Candidatus Vogelbacteria bacterium]|nr:hypothetical protein [Candidatus Vogelbacteria bacterium]
MTDAERKAGNMFEFVKIVVMIVLATVAISCLAGCEVPTQAEIDRLKAQNGIGVAVQPPSGTPTNDPVGTPPSGGGGETVPIPVEPPPPSPNEVGFAGIWATSNSETSVEFGGSLEVNDPKVESVVLNWDVRSDTGGFGGSIVAVRREGFNFHLKVEGLNPDTSYLVELSIGDDRNMGIATSVQTLPRLEDRIASLREASEQLESVGRELLGYTKAASAAADAGERFKVASAVGKLEEIETKIDAIASRGNIRGALDEKLVRNLIGLLSIGTTVAFEATAYLERSEIIADIQYEQDNTSASVEVTGPETPPSVKEKMAKGVSEKLIFLGLAKAGATDMGKLSADEVKLTALKGLIVASYLYRERLLQSIWQGSPGQGDIATMERELLEAEEAIVSLSHDSEVTPLLSEEHTIAIRELRFHVHDAREALADWRGRKLTERQGRARRIVNDLRATYLPQWRGLSQKSKATK